MNHCLHLIVDIGLDMTSFNISFEIKLSNLPKRNAKLIGQQTDKIIQKSENWEKCNGSDLLHAFPKKWWIESVFAAPNLPLPLLLKDSGCHYNSIFCNTGTN
jgi:hypothetical protein